MLKVARTIADLAGEDNLDLRSLVRSDTIPLAGPTARDPNHRYFKGMPGSGLPLVVRI